MVSFDTARKPHKLVRPILILAAVAVFIVLAAYILGLVSGKRGSISAQKLRCVVSQSVTPFGDRILYYDDSTLFCLSTSGNELWNASVGPGASFSPGDRRVAVWNGNQLMVFDRSGRSSYSDRLSEPVQFARIGTKYIAVVTGDSVSPTLTVRDMQGTQIDVESINYTDLMILDCGFFGDGEYLWTTSLDVYGAVPETTMHVYRVGQMNTGNITLGEPITYSVVYSGGYLNIVNTRRLRLFDYRGTENTEAAVLVYGWQMIGATETNDSPYLLFAPVLQTDTSGTFTELRLLHGIKNDTRYSLPDSCVGASIHGRRLYAFSKDTLYTTTMNSQRFTALSLPGSNDPVTDYLGMTSEGVALLVRGTEVWAVTLP